MNPSIVELRNGKRLLATPLTCIRPYQTPCSLDLPTEIRLMIYKYAIRYHNVRWTMTYESNAGFALALGDLHNAMGNRDIKLHHRLSLLRNCRLIFQETCPILHNQTRFHISFDICWYQSNRPLETHLPPKYQLQLTSGRSQITHGLTQVVLAFVKHVRVFMNDTRLSTYIWRMHILSTCLHATEWASNHFCFFQPHLWPSWTISGVLRRFSISTRIKTLLF